MIAAHAASQSRAPVPAARDAPRHASGRAAGCARACGSRGVRAPARAARQVKAQCASLVLDQLPSAALTAVPAGPSSAQQADVSPAASTLSVHVAANCHVEFGDRVVIVGDIPQLGSWNPHAGVALEWGEGDVWTAAVQLPAGPVSFKVVKVRKGGGVEWEAGENRCLRLPSLAPRVASCTTVSVGCAYGDIAGTRVQVEGSKEKVQKLESVVASSAARAGELNRLRSDLQQRVAALESQLEEGERHVQGFMQRLGQAVEACTLEAQQAQQGFWRGRRGARTGQQQQQQQPQHAAAAPAFAQQHESNIVAMRKRAASGGGQGYVQRMVWQIEAAQRGAAGGLWKVEGAMLLTEPEPAVPAAREAGVAGKRNEQAASAPRVASASIPAACNSQARKAEVRPAACSLTKEPAGAGMWWGMDGSSSSSSAASSGVDSSGGASYCSLGEEAWGLPPDQSAEGGCNLPGVLDSEMLAAGMWAPQFEAWSGGLTDEATYCSEGPARGTNTPVEAAAQPDGADAQLAGSMSGLALLAASAPVLGLLGGAWGVLHSPVPAAASVNMAFWGRLIALAAHWPAA